MRITLVHFSSGYENTFFPLGLLCISTYVKKHGHDPIIQKHPRPPLDLKNICQEILNSQPEAIGFSTLYNSLPAALLVAKQCKKQARHIPIIFGGPDASFEDVELLKAFDQVDIVVRGEGEITLLEVLNTLEKKRPLQNTLGISFRNKRLVIKNPARPLIKNLDDLPFPDYSLLSQHQAYEVVSVEGGRGCPNRCTFCSTCKMWGRKFRIKSPERLIEESIRAVSFFKKHGISQLQIIHDNLFVNPKWSEKFLSLLEGKGLSWACDSSYNSLNINLINKLKPAGCRGVFIGVETASSKLQKQIKKNLKLKTLPQVLAAFYKNKIPNSLSFMIGFPNEGPPELNQTLKMALVSKIYNPFASIQINLLSFLKGTDLYNKLKGTPLYKKNRASVFLPKPYSLHPKYSSVEKYPQLFPSFFFIKCSKIPSKFAQKIAILFSFLCNFFPATSFLILKSLSCSPYQLGKKIAIFFDKKDIKWRVVWNDKDSLEFYLPYFKNFLNESSHKLSLQNKEMVIHEELFAQALFSTKDFSSPSAKIRIDSTPQLKSGVKIKSFSYDPMSIIEKIRSNQSPLITKKQSFLVYVPKNMAQPITLSRSLFELLSHCNGENSTKEIICHFSSENDSGRTINTLKSLQKTGII
ncbi:MAG: B12-binding domain-containing radical SAM protein [Candidatus Saganbacteria bacterium]|nr:B12-binding domain-containing radical SAM protein [Candidatus Saganbacteria bacterium]